MKIYFIRLKNHPDKFIGKSRPSLGLATDKKLAREGITLLEHLEFQVEHSEQRQIVVRKEIAKVWVDEKEFRRFVSRCNNQWNESYRTPTGWEPLDLSGSFSEFEVVVIEGENETVFPLDNFLKKSSSIS